MIFGVPSKLLPPGAKLSYFALWQAFRLFMADTLNTACREHMDRAVASQALTATPAKHKPMLPISSFNSAIGKNNLT